VRREEKENYVAELRQNLLEAQIVVRTRFTGVDAGEMTTLRRKVRHTGANYQVVKNNLLKLAVEGTHLEALVEDLKGPIALAYASEDVVGVAKALSEVAEDLEVFQVEGGMLSGKVIEASSIEALSKLPSKDALRAQLLGLLKSVPRNLLGVLQAPSRDMLGVLSARKDSLD
jgi:large subunit ribosomal protein L10